MLKKLLSLSAAAFLFNAASAQTNLQTSGSMSAPARQMISQTGPATAANKVQTTNVTDTLWYFYNKFSYKTPPAQQSFSTVKSPYQTSAVKLSHFGSTFLNTSTITVNGMFVVAARRATSTSTAVPVRILLCNATAAGVPILPAVDSITAVFTGTAGAILGGNLTTPKSITGNFSILYRNASLTTDTIAAYMASTTPTTGVNFSEGLSYLRIAGTFSNTASVFSGSDLEYQVIPIVSFPITASVTPSAASSTCVPTTYTFTNNSSPLLTNRQFNMNKFIEKWQPFATAPFSVADSIFIWNAGDGSGNVNNMPTTYVHTYTLAGTYSPSLTANYQLGADNGQKKSDVTSGSLSVANCLPTGINEASATEMVVFPNPSNGVITVKNMGYNSTLELFNLLGESVYREKASDDVKTIDMSRLPAGNYYLKVTSVEGKSTVKKLHFN